MDFKDIISTRCSIRNYAPEVPSKEILEQVLEAARIAPSAVNFQPWHFTVVVTEQQLKELHKCYHRDWFDTCPACIVVSGNHEEAWHRQADNKDHTDIDVAIAIDHLVLQATDLGLGTCWVCNFDVAKVRELLALPAYMEPIALVPIGYPADNIEMLPQVKKRKNLDDIVKWV